MKTSNICFALVLMALLGLYSRQGMGQLKGARKATVKTYDLLGDSSTPEGISVDQRNGYIYTGSLQDGSIQLTVNEKSSYFIEPGSGVLLPNVLGSAVDEKYNRIWVCSNDFSKTFNGTPTARVSVIDLKDGQVIKQFEESDLLIADGMYPFVNDVVLDKSGNAYVANSASNSIFKISADLSGVQVLAGKFPAPPAGKKYSLNGIEISHDQKFLLTNTFIMGEQDAAALFRVNIASGEVSLIDFEERGTSDFSTSGGDGLLMLDKNTLLCLSVASTLLKFELNEDLSRAVVTNISHGTAAQEVMVGSATIAAYKDNLYTTNAQGMSLFNPEMVVQKPYKVIEIPKKALGL